MQMPDTAEMDALLRSASKAGDIAIIGGGIGGLAAAYMLTRAGARVTVFEATDQLGGLGTFFRYHDRYLDKFYHCLLPTDQHLLRLLRELQLEERVYWKETTFGTMHQGRIYGLNTPLELLRFAPLSLVDRIRVGLTGLWGSIRSPNGLDDRTCVEWLTGLSGERAFQLFWKPMLEAKFGDRYREVPALWFWTRFNREKKGGKRECKGYLRGGYRTIIGALTAYIRRKGGQIKLNSPVETLDIAKGQRLSIGVGKQPPIHFDRVIVTVPRMLKKAVAGGRLEKIALRVSETDMQGVINAVLVLRRRLSKYYWIASVEDTVPFQGIVESTNLIGREDAGGIHLVHLMSYLHRTDPRYLQSDGQILDNYSRHLVRLFPGLRKDEIGDRFLFRAPYVEPLYSTGYQKIMPPTRLLPGRLYLATTAQLYPDVTSWNAVIGLVRRVVDELLSDANTFPTLAAPQRGSRISV